MPKKSDFKNGFTKHDKLRGFTPGSRDGPKCLGTGQQVLSIMDDALLKSKCIYCEKSQLVCDCEKILCDALDIVLKRYRKQVPDFSHDLQNKFFQLKKKMDKDKKRFTKGANQLVVHHLNITIKVLEDVLSSAKLFETINVQHIINYYLELFDNLISKKDYINEINSEELSIYFLIIRSRLIYGFLSGIKNILDYAKMVIENIINYAKMVIENNKRGIQFEYPKIIELKEPETASASTATVLTASDSDLVLEPVKTDAISATVLDASVPELVLEPDAISSSTFPKLVLEPVAISLSTATASSASVPVLNLECYDTCCDEDFTCNCEHTPPPSPPNLWCRKVFN
uniref:Uncharacterized protein n=1 Tax=viral metagenome TaxID=1070528 RepID=A0A6C0BEK9_9ZZZZ